ncbi:hypothetical protein OG404_09260 [Streptomyces griseoaurantiacus]|uniref:hypothetical protein n=1 Tax=Streptomyces griseoaurantiacus TaxID=68213 RepID=UPI00352D98B7
MSDNARDWVWNHSESKGVARLVMLAIADAATGPECWAVAGSTWLMQRTGASRNTVLEATRKMLAIGELSEVPGVLSNHLHPVYVLAKAIGHVPAPPQPPAPGFEPVENVPLTEEHADCSDPEDEEYWKDRDEVRRIAAERIAAHSRKLTS